MAAIGHPFLEVGTLLRAKDGVATRVAENDDMVLGQGHRVAEGIAGRVVIHRGAQFLRDGLEQGKGDRTRTVIIA